MEKEFVNYEIALALKELGFDEPCNTCYDKLEMTASYGENVFDYKNYNTSGYVVSRPTFSQAFRWFRDTCDLHSLIESFNQDEDGNDIDYIFSYRIVTNKTFPKEMNVFFNSYEEAELECLRKLIEIVKLK
jgi:hypothetical protein